MIRLIVVGILLILAQVVVFKNLVLFNVAFGFPYVLMLLVLPINLNRLFLMFLGFVCGLFVDMFYDTAGIHAAASVALAFIRPYWLSFMLSGTNSDASLRISVSNMGVGWFLAYTLPLIFIHITVLFFVEVFGFGMFWTTINKVIWSTLLTLVSVVILQFLFSSPKGRN